MSLKKTNDNKGSYRGAGPYSRDYAKFDSKLATDYPMRDIYDRIESVGDYDNTAAFTGEVSRSGKYRWQKLADRQNTRGDGAYSHEGRKSTERGRRADFGNQRGSKVSD